MANISITIDHLLQDGEDIKFKAPCDCMDISGLQVTYPTSAEEATTETKTFAFKDAHGNDLSSIGNLFMEGTYIKVMLNTVDDIAYIQNADTNGYLEKRMEAIGDIEVSKCFSATLSTEWNGTAAPYTQAVTISGILASDQPIIDMVPSDTLATAEAQEEAWAKVYKAVTAADTITFYAKEKLTTSIPIQIMVVNK